MMNHWNGIRLKIFSGSTPKSKNRFLKGYDLGLFTPATEGWNLKLAGRKAPVTELPLGFEFWNLEFGIVYTGYRRLGFLLHSHIPHHLAISQVASFGEVHLLAAQHL